MSLHFNAQNPFASLASFSNGQPYITEAEREYFCTEACQFFSEKAYMDEHVTIPEPLQARFGEDLACLLGIKRLPFSEKQRTLAAVEKVTSYYFTGLNKKFQMLHPKPGSWASASDPTTHDKHLHTVTTPLTVAPNLPAASRWFDPEKPFESIACFSDRGTLLNHQEQRTMVAAICHFFLSRAQENKTVEIPDEYKTRFSNTDLPLVVNLIPRIFDDSENKKLVKQRVIAAIQKVCKVEFISLDKRDRIYQTYNSSVTHGAFPGWIRASFAQSDARTYTVEQAARGYVEVEPIHLEEMTPLLALMLQQFQYNPLELSAVEVAGTVETALTLLAFAKKWSLTKLIAKIEEWLKQQPKSREVDTAICSVLHKDGVYESVYNSRHRLLEPDVMALSEEAIYQTFRFNSNFIRGGFGVFHGLPDTTTFKTLVRYRQATQDKKEHELVDSYIARKVTDSSGERSFFISVLGLLFTKSEGEFVVQLDRIIENEEIDYPHQVAFLESAPVRQFFTACPGTRYADVVEYIKSYATDIAPLMVRLREAFKGARLPAASTVKELASAVEKRYESKTARVHTLLTAFDGEFTLFEECCNKPRATLDEALKRRLIKSTVKVDTATKYCEIFRSDAMQEFFRANDFLPTGKLIEQLLDFAVKQVKARETLSSLSTDFYPSEYNKEKLDNLERFLVAWGSQNVDVIRLFELLDQYKLIERLKYDTVPLIEETALPIPSQAELARVYVLMRFVEPFIQKKGLAYFAHARMKYLNLHSELSKNHMAEQFTEEVKKLPWEELKELQTTLATRETEALFSKFGLLPIKQFFETKLNDHIKAASSWW